MMDVRNLSNAALASAFEHALTLLKPIGNTLRPLPVPDVDTILALCEV